MDNDQIFDIRAALKRAQDAEDWSLAKRLIALLENEANQRAVKREQRIQDRRFTGALPTGFGDMSNEY